MGNSFEAKRKLQETGEWGRSDDGEDYFGDEYLEMLEAF